jgi:DNA topoisomerase-1
METLTERDYAKLIEKRFNPTEIGIEITDKLQEFFSHLINVKYTANMETSLDDIAEGSQVWYDLLNKFYKEFEPMVKNAFDNMEKKEAVKTGEDCPDCGHPLVIRKSKYGEFVSCSNYPKCKYIKNDKKEVTEIIDCPNCNGKIVEKKTRRGKIFYGCNNYPKCGFALWDKPTGSKCPECGNLLVLKKDKTKCTSCDYMI